MRLDKFVSQASGLSRKQVQKLIRKGEVSVDGECCRDGATKVMPQQSVCLDDEPLQLRGPIYLMLNKPLGVVCSTEDFDHETVLDLLPYDLQEGVHPAGRLDIDTSGLVLLTDDGQWSHRVTSPKGRAPKSGAAKKGVFKRYRVELAEPLCDKAEQRLDEGLMLRGETKPTLPAKLQRLSPTEVLIEIQEGRYHQVKRMFAVLGNRVVGLHREAIGALALDPELEPGQYRALETHEIDLF
ncbi:pseudouridine synthase [Motiliproteus coralliicola]|uniref:Pseudouridine synthase n=2 Tax=Motiliproteus coralliicola TaxID=2283196 RepID=A0A369WDI9_9GAMM|nr:pseudouridine synthase [Motiliproteus coralliicola]RDE19717.1 pseudouridine synthase [Motiliproteus coralliicola]